MSKPKEESVLLLAAAALEDEIRALADLASQAKRESLDTDRSMSRATRALSDSAQYHERIEEKLKTLVGAIDVLRASQQQSIGALLAIAQSVEQRAKSRDVLMRRFAALGESAGQVNELARALSARGSEGASSSELLELLTALDARMGEVVTEAQSVVQSATSESWPEIARQADGLRQQMLAAKNKLALAHKNVAGNAPS